MAKFFDKEKVLDIEMVILGDGIETFDTDVTPKYFFIELFPYNKVLDAYEVDNVETCVQTAKSWECCEDDFADDEYYYDSRFVRCRVDKKSTRFLSYMREKTIDSLMETYMYNERANHCPQNKVDQFNKMLREFLEQRMLDELEGNRTDWLHDKVSEMWKDFCDKEEESEMRKYYAQDDDYALYEAVKYGTNFLILEEEYAGRHIIFDWNLDEDEVEEVVHKFEGIGLTKEDFQYSAEWEEEDFRKKLDPVYYTNLA